MKRILRAQSVMFAGLFLLPVHAVDITIDGTDAKQVMDGFGGSVMNWMSEYKNDAWVRFCTQELGVSIVRCELHPDIICTDNCLGNQTTWSADIAANMAKMDPARSRNDISFTSAAAFARNKLDDMKIVVSIWTQPHWMKEGAQVCNGNFSHGGKIPWTDAGREQNARYLAAAIKAVQNRYGIEIYALSPQNELGMAHPCESYTTSSVKWSTQSDGNPGYNTYIPEVKRLQTELTAAGLTSLKIMGPEEMTVGNINDVWQTWFQMRFVKDMYSDADFMKILDIWCHHDYSRSQASPATGNRTVQGWIWNGHTDANAALNWDGYKDHYRPVWMTEGHTAANTWDAALEFANYMQDAIVVGNLSAYVPWSLGGGVSSDYAVTAFSGGLNTYYRIPTYAFKHFSRYIRPGAVRLGATPDNPAGVTVSAFRHAANGTLTVVMINNGTSAQTANVTLPAGTGIGSFDVYTSASGSYWQKTSAQVAAGKVAATVPGKGMVTLHGLGAAVPVDDLRPSQRTRHYEVQRMTFRLYAINGARLDAGGVPKTAATQCIIAVPYGDSRPMCRLASLPR